MDPWLYMFAYIIGCGVLIHIVMNVVGRLRRNRDS